MQRRTLGRIGKWLFPLLALLLVLPGGASAQAPGEITLPEGAVKITDVIPTMGEHWARPQDMPLGPVYCVWQGKVFCLEYFFTLPMMKRVEVPTPAGPVVFFNIENLNLFDQKVDHMTVEYMYPGVGGFEDGVYAVHVYFIPPEERYQIPFPQKAPSPVATTSPTKPAKAIKVSEVIPAMGEHWIVPGGWPWGPTYLVYKDKLIGVEFEYNHDPLRGAKLATPEGEMWVYDLGLLQVGQTLNHMNIEYLPTGHQGMEFWHFAIHLYSITPGERGQVLPGG